MQAGMSPAATAESSGSELAIPWTVCSYFVLSALGILVIRKRTALRKTAVIAHLLLLIGFCLVVSTIHRQSIGGFLARIVVLGLIGVILCSPWFAVWYALLFFKHTSRSS